MDGFEKPQIVSDGHITPGDKLSLALAQIFPFWSSTRISRWLGVNPRTVQRWLKTGRGDFVDETIPPEISKKILETATHIETIQLGEELDRWIHLQMSKQDGNGVDREVMGAWLADRYKRIMGKDID